MLKTISKLPAVTVLSLIAFTLAAPAAHARITRIVFDRVESPTFGGASFGSVGQYEKLVGRAYGELDPQDEANRGIVYIDKARPNAAGASSTASMSTC